MGKTTLAKNIAKHLTEAHHECVFTIEPGGTPFGVAMRNFVLHTRDQIHLSPTAELFTYLADRTQHIDEVILPGLAEKKVILSDRYYDSSIAYQGEARGLGFDWVEECCVLATRGLAPDLTFYLDLAPELGFERFRGRKPDHIEQQKLSFHEGVRRGYQKLAAKYPERFVTLDARRTANELSSEALAIINKRFFNG